MCGPRGHLGFEFLGDAEEGFDVQPGGLLMSEEGVYNAVSDAAESNFGEVVVPAFFFVAETFCVLSDFKRCGSGRLRYRMDSFFARCMI